MTATEPKRISLKQVKPFLHKYPEPKGVKYAQVKDGILAATDLHKLLIAPCDMPDGLYSPDGTREQQSLNFPSWEKTVPNEALSVVALRIPANKQCLVKLKELKSASDGVYYRIAFDFKEKRVWSAYADLSFSFEEMGIIASKESSKLAPLFISAIYIMDALKVLGDADLLMYKSQSIKRIDYATLPVLLESTKVQGVKVVIMPMMGCALS